MAENNLKHIDGKLCIKDNLEVGNVSIKGDVLGTISTDGATYTVIENPEWLRAVVDSEDKVICGIKADGTFSAPAGIEGLDGKLQQMLAQMQQMLNEAEEEIDAKIDAKITVFNSIFSIVDNLEYIAVETDNEGKILSGRNTDGSKFENLPMEFRGKVSINGNIMENTQDPEGRAEVKTDHEGKIVSYRDSDGVLHEEVGIKAKQIITDSMILPSDAIAQVDERIDNYVAPKNWNIPTFGKVTVKNETFYLTAGNWSSYTDDVVLIQVNDELDTQSLITLSYFYIKSTLDELPGGGYDRTSINENSVRLDFYAATLVTKVDSKYYVTSTLEEGQPVASSIEVKEVVDIAPYRAWVVNKDKHHCVVDIDFGHLFSKNNVPVELSYQGNTTLYSKKRGFRITLYKKNDYKKKSKIKIGEMIRLSGYNMKSYPSTMFSDAIASFTFAEMYESRGKSCYPWYDENHPFTGATGLIKEFPIETWFGDEFFGLQFFGYKKDEKNYLLDGDDDASGIFCSGEVNGNWGDSTPRDWADEMGVKGRELAYPDWEDSVSVETAAAMTEFFKYTKGFMTGTVEIDGQVVPFENSMLEERIDLANWIDYWIGCQVFTLRDNTFHNVILYSGADKKKFYLFFYDLDQALSTSYPYNMDLITACEEYPYGVIDTTFWLKFIDEYKDQIINRYMELRKGVLTYNNIKAIYDRCSFDIPDRVLAMESERWHYIMKDYDESLIALKKRLDYLDEKFFFIKDFN